METQNNLQSKTHMVKIALAFSAISILWGTTYLAIRIAIQTIPPFLMAGMRFILAGGILLTVLVLRGAKLPSRLHWRSALIIGGLMLVGGNGLVTFGESRIASGLAALIVSTEPLWFTLLEWLFYGGKRPTLRIGIGLVLGLTGMALLVRVSAGTGAAGYDLIGIGIVLTATLLWVIGGLYSRRAPLPEDTLMGIAAEMLAGGVLLILLGFITGEPASLNWQAVSLSSVAAMLYLVVFGSIVGYTSFIWLVKTIEPAKVATHTYINPVIAVFLGWLVAGEVITPQTLLAAGVIIAGVITINTRFTPFRRLRGVELAQSSVDASGD